VHPFPRRDAELTGGPEMIVKRNGGMTEFTPSPREKRESLIRDHVLELVGLLHERLC